MPAMSAADGLAELFASRCTTSPVLLDQLRAETHGAANVTLSVVAAAELPAVLHTSVDLAENQTRSWVTPTSAGSAPRSLVRTVINSRKGCVLQAR